jgi:hypothetical protein
MGAILSLDPMTKQFGSGMPRAGMQSAGLWLGTLACVVLLALPMGSESSLLTLPMGGGSYPDP